MENKQAKTEQVLPCQESRKKISQTGGLKKASN